MSDRLTEEILDVVEVSSRQRNYKLKTQQSIRLKGLMFMRFLC